ncbi:hypothetical protein PENTCL1PPCAC_26719, partial [Pristionchus entomophagus]
GEGGGGDPSVLLCSEELGEGGGLVAAIGVADAAEHVFGVGPELGVDLREVVLLVDAGREDGVEGGVLAEEGLVSAQILRGGSNSTGTGSSIRSAEGNEATELPVLIRLSAQTNLVVVDVACERVDCPDEIDGRDEEKKRMDGHHDRREGEGRVPEGEKSLEVD